MKTDRRRIQEKERLREDYGRRRGPATIILESIWLALLTLRRRQVEMKFLAKAAVAGLLLVVRCRVCRILHRKANMAPILAKAFSSTCRTVRQAAAWRDCWKEMA